MSKKLIGLFSTIAVTMIATTYLSVCGSITPLADTTASTPQTGTLVAGVSKDVSINLVKAKNDFLARAKEISYSAYVSQLEADVSIARNEDLKVSQAYFDQIEESKIERAAQFAAAPEEDVQEVAAEESSEVVVESVPEESAPEALLTGYYVDNEYHGTPIALDADNRYKLERLVQGESGGEGFVGAALVAQTIHDTMIRDNNYDVMSIKATHAYSGVLSIAPNQDVKDAVAFIFDQGGMAVQHRLIYFYAPARCSSSFHESQLYVVEYGGHRFFDER